MLLAPMFITPIAVGLIFRFLLNDQIGAIPHLLQAVGTELNEAVAGTKSVDDALAAAQAAAEKIQG